MAKWSTPAVSDDEYFRLRDDYVAGGRRARQKLDEMVISGSAGALALSMTFIEMIAPYPRPGTKAFLLVAWALLIGSLGLPCSASIPRRAPTAPPEIASTRNERVGGETSVN